MISPAFLKKLKELRQSRLRTQDFQKWKAANPVAATGTGVWNAAPWTGQTAQAIVYDTTNGKAFPNPQAALSAGVSNFSYQVPSGMTVDWSYWNQFTQPAPPAPVAQPITVEDQTQPFNYDSETGQAQSPASQPATSAPETSAPEPEPFQMPDQAKRFADAGMFGRASAAVKAAGGTWSKDMHRQLKKDADATKQYGGQFEYDWTGVSKDELKNVKDFAKSGKFGKAKAAVEKAGGTWTKEMSVQLRAKNKRK